MSPLRGSFRFISFATIMPPLRGSFRFMSFATIMPPLRGSFRFISFATIIAPLRSYNYAAPTGLFSFYIVCYNHFAATQLQLCRPYRALFRFISFATIIAPLRGSFHYILFCCNHYTAKRLYPGEAESANEPHSGAMIVAPRRGRHNNIGNLPHRISSTKGRFILRIFIGRNGSGFIVAIDEKYSYLFFPDLAVFCMQRRKKRNRKRSRYGER